MKRTEFLNCQIDFSKHNFLPRAETELWVGKAIKEIKEKGTRKKILKILDIFAGTGCIGTSILKAVKQAKVDFVDILPRATEQIKINLKLNGIDRSRYKIYKSNLFNKLEGKRYDFIFANPPYVALDRISEVQKEVLKNEPLAALFAGKDGMVIMEKFLKQVKNYLKPTGKIFLEFDSLQKAKIEKIAKKERMKVIFKKDQFGKYRWLEAIKT